MTQPKRFTRSTTNKHLGGVCGGLAAYWGIDSLLVRVLWIAVTIASAGVGIVAYLLLWIIAPKDTEVAAAASSPPGTP